MQARRPGRGERLVVLTRRLLERPGHLFSLSDFAGDLGVAKSTLSEDLAAIDRVFREVGEGEIESVSGSAGGVRFRLRLFPDAVRRTVSELAGRLGEPERLLPGGFLYMTDLVFDPAEAERIGRILASLFWDRRPEAVLTVETKGIPLALATARWLGVPLVAARREGRVTEGLAVELNFVSGSSGRIQTMSLPRRALAEGRRVLVVDDFLKAGGTARGLQQIAAAFGSTVVGTGVLVETAEPAEKLVEDYLALIRLESADFKESRVLLRPSPRLEQALAGEGEA